jgi:hypothetical protein
MAMSLGAQGPGKVDILSTLGRRLRAIDDRWKNACDMPDRQQMLLGAVEHFCARRSDVVRALLHSRNGLHHGGWMPLIRAVAEALMITERTLYRWISTYEEVQDTPVEVLHALEDRGIDPTAQKNLPLVKGTVQRLTTGMTMDEAIVQTRAALYPEEDEPEPPSPAEEPMTTDERWVMAARDHIRTALAQVPENRKADILIATVAEILWLLTPMAEP